MNKRIMLFAMTLLVLSISLVCAREMEKRQVKPKPTPSKQELRSEIIGIQSDLYVVMKQMQALAQDPKVQRFIQLQEIDRKLNVMLREKATLYDQTVNNDETTSAATSTADEETTKTAG